MTQYASEPDKSRGCGPLLVALIAVFSLTLGFFAGSGALYYYVSSESGTERLGFATADTVADEPLDLERIYPLAYPLVETLNVPDSVDESSVRDHLHEERFIFKECYTDELERAPDTRGELSVQVNIAGDTGEVVTAVTRANYTGSEQLSDCVLDAIRQEWSFSPPDTSGVASIRFHLLFLPLAQDTGSGEA